MEFGEKRCLGCTMAYTGAVCPSCGYDPAKAPIQINFLAPGHMLANRFLVGKMTANDPEGVWYVGFDEKEQVRVWVREYAPKNLTLRDYDSGFLQTLPGCGAQYKALMSDFEDLCHAIQSLPSDEKVMPILHMVRQNNTVYAIYRYTRMITLETFLRRSGGKLSWRHTKKLLMPLLHTMSHVHNRGLLHRGLSPRTVELDQTGNLWVSCFSISAARTNKSELNALLYDGYAAPEQYAADGWQGTWTDVYALGAILYRTMVGRDPVSARDRVFGDDLLSKNAVPDMPDSVRDAINHALATEVDERIQTPEMFIAQLLDGGSNTAVYTASAKQQTGTAAGVGADPQRLDAAGRDSTAPVSSAAPPAAAGQNTVPITRGAPRKRKKSHKQHPILLSIATTFLGIIIIGGGLYWFATTYLTDLFRLPGQTANSSSQAASVQSASEFSQTPEEASNGKVPMFVGNTLNSIQSNAVIQRRYTFKIEEAFNNDFAEGVVFDQQPVEGTDVPQGGQVTLYVSKGVETVEMPVVVGVPIEEAKALLDAEGIPYQIIEVYNQTFDPDVIVRADREPGTKIDKTKDIVVLYIKRAEMSVPTPTVEVVPQTPFGSSSETPSSGLIPLRPRT